MIVVITSTQIFMKGRAKGSKVSPQLITIDTWGHEEKWLKAPSNASSHCGSSRSSVTAQSKHEVGGGPRWNAVVSPFTQPPAVQYLLSTCPFQKHVHLPRSDSRRHKPQMGELYKRPRSIRKGVVGIQTGEAAEKGRLKRRRHKLWSGLESEGLGKVKQVVKTERGEGLEAAQYHKRSHTGNGPLWHDVTMRMTYVCTYMYLQMYVHASEALDQCWVLIGKPRIPSYQSLRVLLSLPFPEFWDCSPTSPHPTFTRRRSSFYSNQVTSWVIS